MKSFAAMLTGLAKLYGYHLHIQHLNEHRFAWANSSAQTTRPSAGGWL